MDGSDAMKLLVPTAAFAVGAPRPSSPCKAEESSSIIPTQVGLLLYFWPRLACQELSARVSVAS